MDVFSKGKRSVVMSGIRSKNSRSTEQKFIEFLRRARITGWRRNYPLPGKPDFVFPRYRAAVFVDGCFWHCCPHCYDGHLPKTNSAYWTDKLNRNLLRDKAVSRTLRARKWRVFRVRECGLSSCSRALLACLTALRNLQMSHS